MAKTVCMAVKEGTVKRRGKPTIEFHKDGIPQYYCYGYTDKITDELLEVCRSCRDNVIHAQEDLDNWYKEKFYGNRE